MTVTRTIPTSFSDENHLVDWLCQPSTELVEFCKALKGRLVVLGAGGKMGPTLAIRAHRAIKQGGSDAKVTAVSRFSDASSRQLLDDEGIETISADLLDRQALDSLPDAPQVIYLIGSKFGTSQNPSRTWAINTIAPALAMQRYSESSIVALSTGNVYAFTRPETKGSVETDAPGPVGEYANAALGRERIFQYYSLENQTPTALIRLNYAVEMRYGVLVDVGRKVLSGTPIDVTQGYFNCIWQGDANDAIIRALDCVETPSAILNLTGGNVLSVREVAEKFADLFGQEVRFSGTESETALLNNSAALHSRLGHPSIEIDQIVTWTADWLRRGERLLNRPTHFEVRDGGF